MRDEGNDASARAAREVVDAEGGGRRRDAREGLAARVVVEIAGGVDASRRRSDAREPEERVVPQDVGPRDEDDVGRGEAVPKGSDLWGGVYSSHFQLFESVERSRTSENGPTGSRDLDFETSVRVPLAFASHSRGYLE